jgi:hypothetical protein
MTADIAISLLSASLLLPPDASGAAARLDGVLRRVADHGLGHALTNTQLPPGEWCIRRLNVQVLADLSQPDSLIERQWAGALAGAVQRAVNGAGGSEPRGDGAWEVVHYPTLRHAAVDLVTSAASGHRDRVWAWRQVGLAASDIGAAAATPPAELMLGCLARVEDPVGVVVTAADRVGIAALDHALGYGGWLALGRLVAASRGITLAGQVAAPSPATRVVWPPAMLPVRTEPAAPPAAEPSADGPGDQPAPRPQARPTGQAAPAADGRADQPTGEPSADRRANQPAPRPQARPTGQASSAAARAMNFARSLVTSSRLARHMNRARLQPPPSTRRVWALLAAIEADPAVPRRADAAAILTALADLLGEHAASAPPASREMTPEPPPGIACPLIPASTAQPLTGSAAQPVDGPAASPGAAEADDPGRLGVRERHATEWAGLLFLLNTAGDARLRESIATDPVLDGRPVRWILHALAGALVPAGPGDPAALALAGLTPGDAGPTITSPPADNELASVGALASRWATATAHRLVIAPWAGLEPSAVVERVARRPGHVIADPGWIEIHLDLEDVDIDLRRAGLDVDPGWLPWLGAVVRIVYG